MLLKLILSDIVYGDCKLQKKFNTNNVNFSVSKFEMQEEGILYDIHKFVGSLFSCTVAFVCCSLSEMVEVGVSVYYSF